MRSRSKRDERNFMISDVIFKKVRKINWNKIVKVAVLAVLCLLWILIYSLAAAGIRADYDGVTILNEDAGDEPATPSLVGDPCGLDAVFCEGEFVAETTAYNTVEGQCDSSPCFGASGKNICGRNDTLACPRKYKLGSRFEIYGKVWVCEDRTNKKFDGRFDLNFDKDVEGAKKYGLRLIVIKEL